MDYSKNIKRLEEIYSELKDENIALDKAMELFNESVVLIKQTQEYLEKCEGSVTKIKQELDSYFEEKMR